MLNSYNRRCERQYMLHYMQLRPRISEANDMDWGRYRFQRPQAFEALNGGS